MESDSYLGGRDAMVSSEIQRNTGIAAIAGTSTVNNEEEEDGDGKTKKKKRRRGQPKEHQLWIQVPDELMVVVKVVIDQCDPDYTPQV
jgi:hypothetical protein